MPSWVEANKFWNITQEFHDDYYAVPRKNSEAYQEVRELMGLKKNTLDKIEEPKKEEKKDEKKVMPPVAKKETIPVVEKIPDILNYINKNGVSSYLVGKGKRFVAIIEKFYFSLQNDTPISEDVEPERRAKKQEKPEVEAYLLSKLGKRLGAKYIRVLNKAYGIYDITVEDYELDRGIKEKTVSKTIKTIYKNLRKEYAEIKKEVETKVNDE